SLVLLLVFVNPAVGLELLLAPVLEAVAGVDRLRVRGERLSSRDRLAFVQALLVLVVIQIRRVVHGVFLCWSPEYWFCARDCATAFVTIVREPGPPIGRSL